MHSVHDRSYAERLRVAVAETCAAADAYPATEATTTGLPIDRSDPRIISPQKAAAWLKRAERRERYARFAVIGRHLLLGLALVAGLMLVVQ